ncbi:hypothetical protein FDK38_005164 [Candidozyma auris]|nr:hypothetical protein FDK38_005164 [[Candida] auris]
MLLSLFVALGVALAHGSHGGSQNVPIRPAGVSWQEWHMKEEHQMDSFDAVSFFKMHDLENKGYWTLEDVLYVYGLTREEVVGDGSGMGEHAAEEKVSQEAKSQVGSIVMNLLDSNGDGTITLEEWKRFIDRKEELPDFGYGPGHHMDFESEYENHHWNKYHKDQDPDVHVKHKEDIEHELLHHAHEIEGTHGDQPDIRQIAKDYASPIKIHNVPQKYLA